jgi:hypothetical protein
MHKEGQLAHSLLDYRVASALHPPVVTCDFVVTFLLLQT